MTVARLAVLKPGREVVYYISRAELLRLHIAGGLALCQHDGNHSLLAGRIMKPFISLIPVAIGILIVIPERCYSQVTGTPQGIITVNGTAEMTKQPEILRLLIKQYGRGNDLEAAKAALGRVDIDLA